jgi:hypothetical protein
MLQAIPSPLVATEYTVVQPQITLVAPGSVTPANLATLQREVALQAQGEAALLFDGMQAMTTAFSFATIYDIADEAVFRLSNGQAVLLFDHQSKEALRPEVVDETIWAEILKVKNKSVTVQDVATPAPELTIDLAGLWSRVKEHNDLITRTKFFIKNFFNTLSPAMTVRLRGEIPNLPLLTAIYITRPYGHTIIFEDAQGTSVVLFSNL